MTYSSRRKQINDKIRLIASVNSLYIRIIPLAVCNDNIQTHMDYRSSSLASNTSRHSINNMLVFKETNKLKRWIRIRGIIKIGSKSAFAAKSKSKQLSHLLLLSEKLEMDKKESQALR